MAQKFIHCADVHLGAPMTAHLSPAAAEQRRAELLETFCELIAYARDSDVRAVLISGDLFDGAQASATTLDVVLDAMSQAGSVDFLLLPGNHDAENTLFKQRSLPENVLVFGKSWQAVRYDEVVIAGCMLAKDNAAVVYDQLQLDQNDTNIVMMHGQIASKSGTDLVNLNALAHKGIDYAALGHIHTYKQVRLDERGVACYPGCLEGRGFDECGVKGFVELTCQNGVVATEFAPFARRSLHSVSADITHIESISALLDAAQRVCANIPQDDLVRLVLQGSYSPYANKDLAFLESKLIGQFFYAEVKDESHLSVCADDFAFDQSLRGDFVRLVMASSESDEEKQRIIACGLRALRGEEVIF